MHVLTISAPLRRAHARRRRPPRRRHLGVPRPARAGSASPARPGARSPCPSQSPPALPAAPPRRVPGHRSHPDRAAAHRSGRPADGRRTRRADVEVAPGRLFVVGDSKQSIYRFRRADISTFLAARDRFGREAGGAVELTANFRTVEPIIDWVNHTFATLLHEPPDTDVTQPSQPAYVKPRPGVPPGAGPAVAVVGVEPHPYRSPADVVLGRGPRSLGSSPRPSPRAGRSTSRTPTEARSGGRAGWATSPSSCRHARPYRSSRTRRRPRASPTGPSRAHSSMPAARCATCSYSARRRRPHRSPAHRERPAHAPPRLRGDDDLFRHKVLDGRGWSYNTPDRPDPDHGVVSAGLAFLREIHEARHWRSPAELLDRIVRDRRARARLRRGTSLATWRRLRFVIDQARAWTDATGGSLRAYLQWVDQQTLEGSRWPSRCSRRPTTTPCAS